MAELTVAQHKANDQTEPTGRALLDGSQCLCGDEIKDGDLVAANFDIKTVHTGGGLYLLQSLDGWRGCRRMMRVPEGFAIDKDGRGSWSTFPSLDAISMRVVGCVETVYRPTNYQ